MVNQDNRHEWASMGMPTEPIGSVPRPPQLQEAMVAYAKGDMTGEALDALFDQAVRDTIARFEATGSPVISDGEQTKIAARIQCTQLAHDHLK